MKFFYLLFFLFQSNLDILYFMSNPTQKKKVWIGREISKIPEWQTRKINLPANSTSSIRANYNTQSAKDTCHL